LGPTDFLDVLEKRKIRCVSLKQAIRSQLRWEDNIRMDCEMIEKGKIVPLQGWSGPEGSRKLRFPDYVTMAQAGGKVVSLTQQPPLPPGTAPGTHFCLRLSRP